MKGIVIGRPGVDSFNYVDFPAVRPIGTISPIIHHQF